MTSIVHVNLGPRSYDIHITHNDLAGVGLFARQLGAGSLALVVTDENVTPHAHSVADALRAAAFTAELVSLPAGEAQKALIVAERLYDRLIDLQADRRTLIVAVGGGVVGDLSGFVAATYARGVPLLMVPTTLLAMVDSSVGGKVAVNHHRAKNMIGAFHQPVGVWIDTATLATLPDREYLSGLAEVVKAGVIMNAELFAWLESNVAAIRKRSAAAVRHVVQRSCELKASIVERDEREETGLRAILNYGHTFAHAFETASGYSFWLHGEAVAAGMMCAARLAAHRGMIGEDLLERQRTLLHAFDLPTTIEPWPIHALLTTMRTDKKALAGKLRLILPTQLGHAALFDDVSEDEVRRVLQESIS